MSKSNLSLKNAIQLLSGKNFWETNAVPESDIPSFKLSDGPHGLRTQQGQGDHLGLGQSVLSTCFPTGSSLACSFDGSLIKKVGRAIGEEASMLGVGVVLGPAMNIKRSPLCGRNFEYFSEDPYLAGMLAASYAEGVSTTHVSVCLKHFACNGREYGRMVYDATVDERTLRELYLTSFEIAIKGGAVGAVMTAYNRVNGEYCFQNTHLIGDILREEWNFNGLVVSDWGGSYNLAKGIAAGSDLEMPACAFAHTEVEAALKNGELTEEKIYAGANRIAAMAKACQAITPIAYTKVDHDELAVKAAEEGCVLLKNNGTLPLKSTQSVAVIGDFAANPVLQGGGSSHVNCDKTPNLLECLTRAGVNLVGYERGFYKNGKKSRHLSRRAVALAKRADTLVVCLGTADDELAEGADRTSLSLSPVQTELLAKLKATHKPIVVVLFCGDVVETDWESGVSSILLAGYGGQGICRAVCDILTGKVNPSGKLAQSWYARTENIPYSATFAPDAWHAPHNEGLLVGYRNPNADIQYPFGFGLSYTNFEYSDLTVTAQGVTFTLKNHGDREGTEVAQLYIGYPFEPTSPQLKGFARVTLRAGESRRVHIPFDGYTFRAYLGKWGIYDGQYMVYVGDSSRSLPLKEKWQVEGEPVPTTQITAQLNATQPTPNTPTTNKAVKSKRQVVTTATTVSELKYAKGWFGRMLYRFTKLYGKLKGKTVMGSMEYLPLRSLMQFAGFTEEKAQGFMQMLNGKFIKGLHQFLKKNRKQK
jgi:beta-glucosidase